MPDRCSCPSWCQVTHVRDDEWMHAGLFSNEISDAHGGDVLEVSVNLVDFGDGPQATLNVDGEWTATLPLSAALELATRLNVAVAIGAAATPSTRSRSNSDQSKPDPVASLLADREGQASP